LQKANAQGQNQNSINNAYEGNQKISVENE
jgi:hypothetical protein